MKDEMQAITLDGFGGPEVMQIARVAKPTAGAGEVLIRVHATSVNRPDIVQREGNYPAPPGDSEILGLEVAGVVEQVGDGVDAPSVGDRVIALVGGGGYAEYATAHASHCMLLPDTVSFESGACLCETYITAWLNVFRLAALADGESVLLHGGGGGVNTSAIQLCQVLRPQTTIHVTASTGKVDRVRDLGVHHVIDYRQSDFAEEIRTLTNKRGVQVILDHIGGPYLKNNLKSLSVGGRLVVIGVMGGAQAEVNLALMMVKRQQLIGSVLRSRPVQEKADIIHAFAADVMPEVASGRIAPQISDVLPLAEAARAHALMESGGHFGKIVLTTV